MNPNEVVLVQQLKQQLPYLTESVLDKLNFLIHVELQERQKAIEEMDGLIEQEHEDTIKVLAEKIDKNNTTEL